MMSDQRETASVDEVALVELVPNIHHLAGADCAAAVLSSSSCGLDDPDSVTQ
jgi:hypothetical protein